jgi:uncharacterized protein (TIGR02996 family)
MEERRMTHEDVFLQDILENRDDDTPRRIYADWLLDHDDPVIAARGEFIHVQCDLARLPPEAVRPAALVRREQQLLDAHVREWGSPFQRLGCKCWEFRRGFVEGAGMPASAFLAQGAALFRCTPVRELKLYQVGGLMAELSASPYLARLQVLDLEKNEVGDADLEALARSNGLGELASLLLWSNHVGDGGVRALAAAELPRLARLDLSANSVADAGAEALAVSSLLKRLTMLDLSSNQIGDTGARALADSSRADRLEWLALARNPISPAGQNLLRERFAARVHVWG